MNSYSNPGHKTSRNWSKPNNLLIHFSVSNYNLLHLITLLQGRSNQSYSTTTNSLWKQQWNAYIHTIKQESCTYLLKNALWQSIKVWTTSFQSQVQKSWGLSLCSEIEDSKTVTENYLGQQTPSVGTILAYLETMA